MAIKSQSGSGSTSRDYRKGLKSALKANQYKVTSQKKGAYGKISAKLAKKAKAGDKSAAGAGAAYSMLRQEAAASRRGGGGTASASIANRKRTVTKTTGGSYTAPTVKAPATTARTTNRPGVTKKVTQSTSARKEIGKGITGVIKANKFKPVAQKLKNSNYGKLDATLRSRIASANKTGNYTAAQRAEGARRGISVMRQDAAMARRGSGSQPRKAISVSARQDAAASARNRTKKTAVKRPSSRIAYK